MTPQRNPITYSAHRRQTLWQIYFPLVFFLLVVVTLAVLAALANDRQQSLWADISIIYFSVFLMIVALVNLIFIIMAVYILHRGLEILPFKTLQAQAFLFKIERKIRAVSDQSVEPFLRLSSFKAGVQAVFRRSRTG